MGIRGYEMVRRCLEALEGNFRYKVDCVGEPCLGRRGLYPTLSRKGSATSTKLMTNFLAYADGTNDLVAIAERIGASVWDLFPIVSRLKEAKLISVVDSQCNIHPTP